MKRERDGEAGQPRLEVTPEVLAKVHKCAFNGMTKKQIAAVLGIGYSTFFEIGNRSPEFLEAFDQGRADGIDFVTEKFMHNININDTKAQMFFLKCKAGWKEKKDNNIVLNTRDLDLIQQKHRDASSEYDA